MAIKTDRVGTAFTFFTLSQLYGVWKVLGLLYLWPWVGWNTGGKMLLMCEPGKYGWTFVSCKAFKFCS